MVRRIVLRQFSSRHFSAAGHSSRSAEPPGPTRTLSSHCLITTLLLISVFMSMTPAAVQPVNAGPNASAKWALHYVGPHDPEANTCDFSLFDCWTDTQVTAPEGPGDYDVYVIGVEVYGISATRFGIYGEGHFEFMGWTGCATLELPTEGWPGCGEGIALAWDEAQMDQTVTVGILHIYAYGSGRIWAGPDPRVGFAEWCDASDPAPRCDELYGDPAFGFVGIGMDGCNPCGCYTYGGGCVTPGFDLAAYGTCAPVPVEDRSWGSIKALYR